MDEIQLLYQIPVVILRFLFQAATTIVKRDNVRPLRRRLVVAMARSLMTTLSDRHSSRINPTTTIGVQILCKKHSLALSKIEIPIHSEELKIPPAFLHVIDLEPFGDSGFQHRRSVLYLHGGGYVNYPSPTGQIVMAYELARAAGARYLLILEYGLAPKVPYPGQTVQAIAALQILSAKSAVDIPSDVTADGSAAKDLLTNFNGTPIADDLFLVGESAGGHLALSLLAHLSSPCPYAPAIELSRPFRAAVLLSPWVSTTYNSASYITNAKADFLSREKMLSSDKAWNPKKDEVWAELLKATPSNTFWKDIFQGPGRFVDKTLVTVGTDEIFLDDIVAMADAMGVDTSGSNVQIIKCAGEPHAGIVVDIIARIDNGDMRTGTIEFLAQFARTGVNK